ncbi:MAG: AraC family transcriptional regulator [Pyrinomonadaceae bacterium]
MNYYQTEILRIKSERFSNEWQIEKAISTRQFIESNFDNSVTLDVLARTQFTSKYHLLRLYKKYYGQTPKQFLTDVRIEKAKLLLRAGISVTETCFSVGFENPGSFSSLFKGRTGMTPSEFQKRATFAKSD